MLFFEYFVIKYLGDEKGLKMCLYFKCMLDIVSVHNRNFHPFELEILLNVNFLQIIAKVIRHYDPRTGTENSRHYKST